MASPTDLRFMRQALDLAYEGIRTGNGEVGVVVTKASQVVYSGYNAMNTTWDVTGHAEIVALRTLSMQLKTFDLAGHTLYCTLAPCTMCAAACVWAHLDRVVYGAGRGDAPNEYFDSSIGVAEVFAAAGKSAPRLTPRLLPKLCAQLYHSPNRTRLTSAA
jgi:tRNA(Arg) A34 adenosine deaminase TadA